MLRYYPILSKAQFKCSFELIIHTLLLLGLGYHQRQVSNEEGQALANKFGCPYIETSAAHRRHVDDVFHTLVGEIKRQRVGI